MQKVKIFVLFQLESENCLNDLKLPNSFSLVLLCLCLLLIWVFKSEITGVDLACSYTRLQLGMDGEELTEQETALYDRQIRVWGADAQRRFLSLNFLYFPFTRQWLMVLLYLCPYFISVFLMTISVVSLVASV